MSVNTLHVIVKREGSKEHTTFHVNRSLCDTANAMGFYRNNGRTELCKGYGTEANVEPLALMLADEIFHIDGIQYGELYLGAIKITKYTLSVTHGLAFDENDIEFEVIVTIAGVLGIDLDQVTFELDNSAREPQHVDDNSSRISWSV